MKPTPAIFAVVAFTVAISRIQAQTLNWENSAFGDLSDSNSAPLNETLVFEHGSPFNGFVPTASNPDPWTPSQEVFDQASYNNYVEYFDSTVYWKHGVAIRNSRVSSLSLAGLNSYIWMGNDGNRGEGAKWLLERDVIEWSASDLEPGYLPEWGRQNDVVGSGELANATSTGLETFIQVPEPSSSLLAAVAVGLQLVRRRRSDP